MTDHLPAQAHGPITEVFPNVFVVRGTFRIAAGLSITRNMTVVRRGSELTLVNSVRLTSAGEEELAKLGTVTQLLRIGAFHGADDPYYVERYGVPLWAPPRTRHRGSIASTHELKPGHSPLQDAEVFAFERARRPEVAIVLQQNDGVLVTTDSYQHWTTFDGCSPIGKIMMRMMGFGPTLIGGPWARAMGPDIPEDFGRLRERPFRHLIPGHGTVLRDTAKEGLERAIAHRF